jgi:cobalamin synthase
MALDFKKTSRGLWQAAGAYVTKTSERKWTAAGVGIALGLALIAVPPLGIAAFGTAIAGWWIVVAVVTIFGGMAGNRLGIELERRRSRKP